MKQLPDAGAIVFYVALIGLAIWLVPKFVRFAKDYLRMADEIARQKREAVRSKPAPSASPRQPVTPKPLAAYVSPYANAEQESHLELVDGLPNLHFVVRNGDLWLAIDESGLLVSAQSRYLQRLGIYGFNARGTKYHPSEFQSLKFQVGMPVELVREPDNEHDKNAIAVDGGTGTLGYVNRGKASSLAKKLDAGDNLHAIALRREPLTILVTTPNIFGHLARSLDPSWSNPARIEEES